MTSWLVTGGAGYIGSTHRQGTLRLGEHGRGARRPVHRQLRNGSARHHSSSAAVLDTDAGRPACGSTTSGASSTSPRRSRSASRSPSRCSTTAQNIDGAAHRLLDAATAAGVESFVFSSSAAVYGMPSVEKVTEDDGGVPLSPYGETKLAGEWISRAVGRRHGMRVISLRYFNVAGAASVKLGDPGVFNLIPHGVPGAEPRRDPEDLRRRLPDAGRHLHPRLRPRLRHRRRARRGVAAPRRAAVPARRTTSDRGVGSSVLRGAPGRRRGDRATRRRPRSWPGVRATRRGSSAVVDTDPRRTSAGPRATTCATWSAARGRPGSTRRLLMPVSTQRAEPDRPTGR